MARSQDFDMLPNSRKMMAAALMQRMGQPNPSLGGSVLNGLSMGLLGLIEKDDENKQLDLGRTAVELYRPSAATPPAPAAPMVPAYQPPDAPPSVKPELKPIVKALTNADANKFYDAVPSPMQGAAPLPEPAKETLVASLNKNDPRGIRNNNPLNMEASAFTQAQPGYQGSDGRFGRFGTMEEGYGAADKLLQSYGQRGINTVGGVINRWAPPSDGNPVSAYAASVAKAAGLDPNTPIDLNDPAIRQKILPAMAQFENGRPVPMGQPQNPMQAPLEARAAQMAATMQPQGQPAPQLPPPSNVQGAPQPFRLAQAGGQPPMPPQLPPNPQIAEAFQKYDAARAAGDRRAEGFWQGQIRALGQQEQEARRSLQMEAAKKQILSPSDVLAREKYDFEKQNARKPAYGVIGERNGEKVYGWTNPHQQSVTPYQMEGGGPQDTVPGPDGKPIPIPPGVDRKAFITEITRITADAVGGKKTEVQSKSEKFGNKMELAEKNLNGIDNEGASALGRMTEGTGWLPGSSAIGRYAQSDSYQKYAQARNNFITALLRDESGAAIGTEEFNRYEKELFPQPGDGAEVIKQKREARRVAIEGMKKSAGPGYKPPTAPQTDLKQKYGLD